MSEIKLSGVSIGAYERLVKLIPSSVSEDIKKKLDTRAKFCASCINFSKLNLFCSKCGCAEHDPTKFATQKFLDMSYHCPQKYW